MIQTYLLDSSALPDPLDVPEKLHTLARERVEKIYRIKHLDTRKQSFGAGLLLDYALRRQLGTAHPYPLAFNFYGKPVCGQAVFNLSHTEHFAIVSIWEKTVLEEMEAELSIGCDIEPVRMYQPKIARRFFTENEYACLETVEKQMQDEQFCRYWTRKESVIKMTGLGMSMPIDLFDISQKSQIVPDRQKIAAWRETEGGQRPESRKAADLLRNGKIFFGEYSYGGCCITVCSTSNRFAPKLLVVGVLELV